MKKYFLILVIIIIIIGFVAFLFRPKEVITWSGLGGPSSSVEFKCFGIRKSGPMMSDSSSETCSGIIYDKKCFYDGWDGKGKKQVPCSPFSL